VIWVNGYGWPVYRGGPMFWADQIGVKKIYDALNKYHEQTGDAFWKPAPLLKKLAETGGTFASL
jgi:3-hydroxyacyl-CoA dehydrogenase